MGGISCNAEGFAGETGAVNVLEGGERDTNDLLSCSHYALKGLVAGCVASAIHLHYIYIYAFSRRFYPKRLTLHSSYSFYLLSALAFPGNRTHDLGVASAMLYHLSYRKVIPHSDAASQDALDGASVEGAHDGGRGSGSSQKRSGPTFHRPQSTT